MSSNTGTSIFTLLTVLFIGLKLAGVITWSWLAVISPTLIQIALSIICIVVYAWAKAKS